MKELLSKINKMFDAGCGGADDNNRLKNYCLKYLGDVAASDVDPDAFELDDDAWLEITNKSLRAAIFASFAAFVLGRK